MMSIIRYKDNGQDIRETVRLIEAVTNCEVTSVEKSSGYVSLTLEHHEGQSCSTCGEKIHNYGHGLCLACWLDLKASLGL